MLVPRYWSEAKKVVRRDKSQTTLRRWGWSSNSQTEADIHAGVRIEQAYRDFMADPIAKMRVPKREPKRAYNGAEGVPIREEIVEERGVDVVTRNSYGALCLNTPDVLIIDIDTEHLRRVPRLAHPVALVAAIVMMVTWASRNGEWGAPGKDSTLWLLMLGSLAYGIFLTLLKRAWWALFDYTGGAEQFVRRRLRRRVMRHPGENWRLYRTPLGMRVLGAHATFDPKSMETSELMEELSADPLYLLMCQRQGCFRARVSAKPWRIPGITRWRGAVWPVVGPALERRTAWVQRYEVAAAPYAACAFVMQLGDGHTAARAHEVIVWHDDLSSARRGKPLA